MTEMVKKRTKAAVGLITVDNNACYIPETRGKLVCTIAIISFNHHNNTSKWRLTCLMETKLSLNIHAQLAVVTVSNWMNRDLNSGYSNSP